MSVLITIVAATLIELIIDKFNFSWLLNHNNSYGIRATFYLLILFAISGITCRPWRIYLFGTAVLSLLRTFLQLIGGPSRP